MVDLPQTSMFDVGCSMFSFSPPRSFPFLIPKTSSGASSGASSSSPNFVSNFVPNFPFLLPSLIEPSFFHECSRSAILSRELVRSAG